MPAIYTADCFCDSCADRIRERIIVEGQAPRKRWDETSYDSDEFPKYMLANQESDSPQHCGSHVECLEAETLADGAKVGALLSRSLTPDGVAYVQEAIDQGGLVADFWREEFASVGYEFDG